MTQLTWIADTIPPRGSRSRRRRAFVLRITIRRCGNWVKTKHALEHRVVPREFDVECACQYVARTRVAWLSIDFDFQILVQPHKAHESIAAEDRHYRHVTSTLQTFLKIRI